tara:strand:+ start:76 stop:279 length:204 start_codon:yes stop_codon:yes gene_type:complete
MKSKEDIRELRIRLEDERDMFQGCVDDMNKMDMSSSFVVVRDNYQASADRVKGELELIDWILNDMIK